MKTEKNEEKKKEITTMTANKQYSRWRKNIIFVEGKTFLLYIEQNKKTCFFSKEWEWKKKKTEKKKK